MYVGSSGILYMMMLVEASDSSTSIPKNMVTPVCGLSLSWSVGLYMSELPVR